MRLFSFCTYHYLLLFSLLVAPTLCAQSIAEKRESLAQKESSRSDALLQQVNGGLQQLRQELSLLNEKAQQLQTEGGEEAGFQQLLSEIRAKRREMGALEEEWRQSIVDEA